MPAIIEPVGPPAPDEPRRPLAARLAWFFGLAAGGVGAVAALAYGLHILLFLR